METSKWIVAVLCGSSIFFYILAIICKVMADMDQKHDMEEANKEERPDDPNAFAIFAARQRDRCAEGNITNRKKTTIAIVIFAIGSVVSICSLFTATSIPTVSWLKGYATVTTIIGCLFIAGLASYWWSKIKEKKEKAAY